MNSNEYLEIKSLLLEQKAMLEILMPSKATLSYICQITGRSRQCVKIPGTGYIIIHFLFI